MNLGFGPIRWFTFGPFMIQASRALLYPTYFFAGVGIGACGIERGLLAHDGQLARRWAWWLVAAAIAFAFYAIVSVILAKTLGSQPSLGLRATAGVAFVLYCGAISFFFLALFVRFANRRNRIVDSLSANAYGMYLVHYTFVIWLQYGLLNASLPEFLKGLVVFVATLLLSWATVAGIRTIPLIDRILSSGARPITRESLPYPDVYG